HRDAQAAAEAASRNRQGLVTEHAEAVVTQTELNQEIALAAQAAELPAATCEETRAELPEPYRSLLGPGPISDWSTVTYPTRADWRPPGSPSPNGPPLMTWRAGGRNWRGSRRPGPPRIGPDSNKPAPRSTRSATSAAASRPRPTGSRPRTGRTPRRSPPRWRG